MPNALLWDEETSGSPHHHLHIGAIHWFWERVIKVPTKVQTNVLLLQTERDTVAGNLAAWLPAAPNIILCWTGSARVDLVKQTSQLAFEDPPPSHMDPDMLDPPGQHSHQRAVLLVHHPAAAAGAAGAR